MSRLNQLMGVIQNSRWGIAGGDKLYTPQIDARLLEVAGLELLELRERLAECEDNLKSMVEQYCGNGYCHSEHGVPINKYSHDFMSAGEYTFEYLVKYGLAEWTVNGVDIRLKHLEISNEHNSNT